MSAQAKLMTFEEFRVSRAAEIRRQNALFRDSSAVQRILQRIVALAGWPEWPAHRDRGV